MLKLERNGQCPCGSGKKYKKCCQRVSESSASAQVATEPLIPPPAECDRLATLFYAGRFVELEMRSRLLLEQYPDSGVVWKVLGAALQRQGKNALPAMKISAGLLPEDAEVHNNLGMALKDRGHLDEAVTSYGRALAIKPEYAEAHSNLGNALKNLGRLDDAMASYRRALEIKPDFAEAHSNLGSTLYDLRRLDDAATSYRQALAIKPEFAEAHSNLGATLHDLELLDDAVVSYRRALEIKPDYAEAHFNLGVTLYDLGQLDAAVASFGRALAIKPEYAEAHSNLGSALAGLGQLGAAMASYGRALAIKPEYAEAHSNLGVALQEQGRLSEAEAGFRRALEINPHFAEAYSNLGNTLNDQGRFSEAEASLRRALEIEPSFSEAHSALLFVMNYNAGHAPLDRVEEARNYGRTMAKRVDTRFTSWQCERQPERLRVGMVSGDLRNHAAGHFLEGLLTHLNPARVELIAYPTNTKEDDLTGRIRPCFAAWKPLVGHSDDAAARLIHGDGVHVLLDLSGHSANNRLPVFARKPAPVQTSWLGYFATTGLAQMDFFLGDQYICPEDEAAHFVERAWRLPEIAWCFTPPAMAPDVGPLPALTNGYVTFGSFNRLAKMNDAVVASWARVLHAVPNSRLFLNAKELADDEKRHATLQCYAKEGIAPHRLILEDWRRSREEHLGAYNRVDIALDPFPYLGHTTSVEGLWMGVPVITRRGGCYLSHFGESVNVNAGLADWIAVDEDDYLAKAVRFAANLVSLAELRAGLRAQVLASPLFDAPRFARNFEAALWGMWRGWCE